MWNWNLMKKISVLKLRNLSTMLSGGIPWDQTMLMHLRVVLLVEIYFFHEVDHIMDLLSILLLLYLLVHFPIQIFPRICLLSKINLLRYSALKTNIC
ncbi:hypothetical protein X975_00045, partial [Stegodyphus mimosarum]